MSDLEARRLAADLLSQTLTRKPGTTTPPAPAKHLQKPLHAAFLFFGVILPAAVLILEIAAGWCRQVFFDPIPTLGHAALIAAVPLVNLWAWAELRENRLTHTRALAVALGATMAISGFYALVFLPLMPIAIVAIAAVGLGLLPLSPLLALVASARLAARLPNGIARGTRRRALAGGVALGAGLLAVFDLPLAATHYGIRLAAREAPSERDRGVAILRTIGNEELLRALCYDASGRPAGLLSLVLAGANALWDGGPANGLGVPTQTVREVYYRVTGEAFNARPMPHSVRRDARFAGITLDEDLGGTEVGGNASSVSLASSRLDGSISGDDLTAYMEWVLDVRNDAPTVQEARLEIALPEGAVVSRASLWINGEEREAAYGTREATRAAYQQVAVRQRRDPLLVTTRGAGRVMLQAFPVPAGGHMKFKVGITAPLAPADDLASATLVLPAIINRNFALPEGGTHEVWLESKSQLRSCCTLVASHVGDGLHRLKGRFDHRVMTAGRPQIRVARDKAALVRAASYDGGHTILQELVRSSPPVPAAVFVIDGSKAMGAHRSEILASLEAIPAGRQIGVVLAAPGTPSVPVAPWSAAQRRAVTKLLEAAPFTGGEDNGDALVAALGAAESFEHAHLVWVHAAQPVAFRGSRERLEQAAQRLARLPAITLLAVEPGPNALLPDAPWAAAGRLIRAGRNVDGILSHLIQEVLGDHDRPVVRRTASAVRAAAPEGSDHIVLLWAADEIARLMQTDPEKNRAEATALAVKHRLVTPVSGAVVLETQAQYDAAGLNPAKADSVPTVPEPHEWALLIMVALALAHLAWTQRRGAAQGASA